MSFIKYENGIAYSCDIHVINKTVNGTVYA